MSLTAITAPTAPAAIGTYSQAIKVGNTVYLSGQIPLIPQTLQLHTGSMEEQIQQVLQNLRAVAQAAGGDLQDIVKLTVYLTDLTHFPVVNEIMSRHFQPPYPARAVVGVASLPKGANIEMEAILQLPS